jgi:hypothetical protein
MRKPYYVEKHFPAMWEKMWKTNAFWKQSEKKNPPHGVCIVCIFVYGVAIGTTGTASFPRGFGVGNAPQNFAHVGQDGQTSVSCIAWGEACILPH